MDTQTFLRTILPQQGHYVLATFRPGYHAPSHAVYPSTEALAAAARAADAQGLTAYHACAGFVDPALPPNKGLRKATNAGWVRAQWVDLDVGEGKDYATRTEAKDSLVSTCKLLGLPAPLIVASGAGLHAYWVFERDIPAEQARRSMHAFAEVSRAYGLRHDPSRTSDLASVLRPAGTHWRKGDQEREVKVVFPGAVVPYDAFCVPLMAHMQAPLPDLADPYDEFSTGRKNQDYPPSSGVEILKHCPAMAAVVETTAAGGYVPEPLWRNMVGLAKRTVEGEELAHTWSQGDSRYSWYETQRKLDNWTSPPPTCLTIESSGGACAGCKFAHKKSPIHLGYNVSEEVLREEQRAAAEAPTPPTEAKTPSVAVPTDIETVAFKLPHELGALWPADKYRWEQDCLKVKVLQEAAEGGEPIAEWVPFSMRYVYPYMRVRLADGTYAIEMCALKRNGTWDTFQIPTKVLGDERQLRTALAAHECYVTGKNGKEIMSAFLRDILQIHETHSLECREVTAYGWTDDGFVLGEALITADGERPVLPNRNAPTRLREGLTIKGSAKEAVKLIDTLYNRPGAEPLQFIICAALAAPLVKLFGAELYHGIPIALTGESGQGKTSVALAACSIYGRPGAFLTSAHEMGTTTNAMIQSMAINPHLPQIFDELHGMRTADLPTLLYALSNGAPKSALRSDRTFNDSGHHWDTLTFVTSNSNISSLLSTQERNKAEATQLRIWEINLPDGYLGQTFNQAEAKVALDTLLMRHYGVIGHHWLKTVTKLKDQFHHKLFEQRAQYAPDGQEMTRERFFYDTLTCVMVAARAAKKMGIIQFDLKAMEQWALDHIRQMRETRVMTLTSVEEALTSVLSRLSGRTVYSKSWPKAKRVTNDEFVDESRLRHPIARVLAEENILVVTRPGFVELCNDLHVSPSGLIDEMTKLGVLADADFLNIDARGRCCPFRGTSMAIRSMQTRVVAIDLSAVDAKHIQDTPIAIPEDNVVQLRAAKT